MADLSGYRRIHLVGAGGAGMSALAKLLAGWGWVVTGSDVRSSASLAVLGDIGIEVWTGHCPERMGEVDLVVASSAVPDTDPELRAAADAGRPVWRRPELLEALSRLQPTIGATGTHGKTSTTAMLVAALRAAGRDPSFVIGAEMSGLGTNAVVGTDELLVLEVDEAFGTFEQVHLGGLVITNVEADHVEHFGSVEALEDAFVRVARGVDGPVVACADDPGSRRVAERADVATYGTSTAADYRMTEVTPGVGQVAFRLTGPDLDLTVHVPRAGLHMARNAAGALILAARMGADPQEAAAGISRFQGVRRRFEYRGTVAGVTVVDDYAHHPTEVAATLRAARSSHPGRVWAVFQPHLYSRTQALHREFGQALALADRVVVTDVYGAREDPIPGVTGELVAAAVERVSGSVDYVPHLADLASFLADRVDAGDLVITMGAGDVTVVPGELLARLAEGEGRG